MIISSLTHSHVHAPTRMQMHARTHTHAHTYIYTPLMRTHICMYSPPAANLTYLSDWKNRLPYMDSDFQFVEPVLTLRSSILHSLLRRTAMECGREASPPVSLRRRVERLFAALTDTLLTQARLAREAGSYQVRGK